MMKIFLSEQNGIYNSIGMQTDSLNWKKISSNKIAFILNTEVPFNYEMSYHEEHGIFRQGTKTSFWTQTRPLTLSESQYLSLYSALHESNYSQPGQDKEI